MVMTSSLAFEDFPATGGLLFSHSKSYSAIGAATRSVPVLDTSLPPTSRGGNTNIVAPPRQQNVVPPQSSILRASAPTYRSSLAPSTSVASSPGVSLRIDSQAMQTLGSQPPTYRSSDIQAMQTPGSQSRTYLNGFLPSNSIPNNVVHPPSSSRGSSLQIDTQAVRTSGSQSPTYGTRFTPVTSLTNNIVSHRSSIPGGSRQVDSPSTQTLGSKLPAYRNSFAPTSSIGNILVSPRCTGRRANLQSDSQTMQTITEVRTSPYPHQLTRDRSISPTSVGSLATTYRNLIKPQGSMSAPVSSTTIQTQKTGNATINKQAYTLQKIRPSQKTNFAGDFTFQARTQSPGDFTFQASIQSTPVRRLRALGSLPIPQTSGSMLSPSSHDGPHSARAIFKASDCMHSARSRSVGCNQDSVHIARTNDNGNRFSEDSVRIARTNDTGNRFSENVAGGQIVTPVKVKQSPVRFADAIVASKNEAAYTTRKQADVVSPKSVRSNRSSISSSLEIVELPNPNLELLPPDTRATVDKITQLLNDREVLKMRVVCAFKKAVSESDGSDTTALREDGDEEELDSQALHVFRESISSDLSLPAEAFGTELDIELLRFDFTGTGKLRLNEVYKLVKFHLREYRKELGGAPVIADIPFSSIEEAGFLITQELGTGSQGTAHLAEDIDGNKFCIKCYPKEKMLACSMEDLRQEFETLRLLACDSIAGACTMFQDTQNFCMIGDAFYGGDLMTLRQRAMAQNVEMNENWWRDVFKQVFEALAFMHKQAVVHCDIKEPNIMIKTEDFHAPQVVVIDLGVARAMAARHEGTLHGTPGYVPPETLETRKWFPTGDIFSFGVVIVQLLTDNLPQNEMESDGQTFRGGIFIEGCKSVKEVFRATMTRQPPFHLMPQDMLNLREVAEGCLEKKMNERLHSNEALRLPLFTATARSKARKGTVPLWLHPKSEFATVGITASFLKNMDSLDGDELDEAEKERGFLAAQLERRKKSEEALSPNVGFENDEYPEDQGSDDDEDCVVVASARTSVELAESENPLAE